MLPSPTAAANTTECPSCHAQLHLGDFPFCPHGRGSNSIEDVTWPGGKWFENLAHEPIRCDSPADLKREMKLRGLEPMVRHTDGDPHTRSWATMDPYTLEQGRILAERQGTTKATTREPDPSPETVAIVRQVFQL